MNANKIVLNDEVLVDLTQDTVAEEDVTQGKTFHKADGSPATGTSTAIVPSGTLVITENDTYDVTDKASVEVNVAGSGGGGDDTVKSLIEGTLTELNSSDVTSVGDYAFYKSPIKVVSFPKLTTVGSTAFSGSKLESIYAPLVTTVKTWGFGQASLLKTVNFPNLKSLESYAFYQTQITEANFPNITALREYAFYQTPITEANFPAVTRIERYCFSGCSSLQSVSLPNATYGQSYAWQGCTSLESVELPKMPRIYSSSFEGCTALKNIVLPLATAIEGSAFKNCSSLEKIDMSCSSVGGAAFQNCYSLKTVIIRYANGVASLGNSYSLSNCYHIHGTVNATYNPNGDKDGYIYVPKSRIDSYKTATNWVTVADQFRAIEDYPEICGEV